MTTDEFLSAELAHTQAELSGPILNRGRWDSLREDRRMLQFLQGRTAAPDFAGVEAELRLIAEGRIRVPEIDGPRGKAESCLRSWRTTLGTIASEGQQFNDPGAQQ
jgi:hypothetical protein